MMETEKKKQKETKTDSSFCDYTRDRVQLRLSASERALRNAIAESIERAAVVDLVKRSMFHKKGKPIFDRLLYRAALLLLEPYSIEGRIEILQKARTAFKRPKPQGGRPKKSSR